MEKSGIRIDILPNYFLKQDGTFDRDGAINLCGKIAGICYDKEGFNHLKDEPIERTNRRIDMTLNNGHHSVYDHITINFNIQNIPKILAMMINNEHQYTTSEKSARYTPVVRQEESYITKKEEQLYHKWLEVFKEQIKLKYGDIYSDNKILKLAQENARYLITIFMPTQMIYSTSLRQINYIASWMKKYIKEADLENPFEKKLALAMKDFLQELDWNNILEEGLLKNEKMRSFSLFGTDLDKKEEYFGDVYSTTYKGSFAELAQAQRHRTLDYQIELLGASEYYIPPIIIDNSKLVRAWINDMESVKDVYPQGQLIRINEMGKYEDFILKCKERLCTGAQLEIMEQTREILHKYQTFLLAHNNPLMEDIKKYCNGARCTFRDFTCTSDCKFKEGKTLTRKI